VEANWHSWYGTRGAPAARARLARLECCRSAPGGKRLRNQLAERFDGGDFVDAPPSHELPGLSLLCFYF
jgi:hypothetical protein